MHSVTELQGRYEIHPETVNEPWFLYVCNDHFQLENRIHDFSSTTEPQMPKQQTQRVCSICHQAKALYGKLMLSGKEEALSLIWSTNSW